ncbi:MAG: fumarate reductase iron-sulfur subunit, partial [Chloroflexi bacterium]|nr:fumarate reductase iron-sulfur subunit [Chloroflexota bacterium]
MSEETMTLVVTRFRPGHDREPRAESFAVPYRQDWVVLDALNHIKDRIDG